MFDEESHTKGDGGVLKPGRGGDRNKETLQEPYDLEEKSKIGVSGRGLKGQGRVHNLVGSSDGTQREDKD